ncbi:MAG: SDR family oxidoreductase [Pseudomonadota bacterium]
MHNAALITGASSGIGREFARIHAEKGGDLVLVARRADRLEELKTELEAAHGVSVWAMPEDLGDEGAPERIFENVTAKDVALDVLINNAGFGARGNFHEQDWAVSRNMIQVNTVALAALTRLFLPGFVERNRGRILNVTSTAALQPGPLQAVYFASKVFAAFLSNALVEELRDTAVTVTNFMPSATATEFASASGMDATQLFRQAESPRTVAEEGYAAMMQGKMDAFGGLRPIRRLQYWMMGRLPKRMLLRIVRRAQDINES